MEIYFLSPSNKMYEIIVEESDTILQIKEKLSHHVKQKPENIMLLFQNEQLAEDDATFDEYNITHKDILSFLFKQSSTNLFETHEDSHLFVKPGFTHTIPIKKLLKRLKY